MNPVRRLRCRMGGHKVDLFPRDSGNVLRLAYTCGCGRAWVSREVRDHTLNERLAEFTGAA